MNTRDLFCLTAALSVLAGSAHATDWGGKLKSIIQSPAGTHSVRTTGLSEAEMTSGLKEALAVGTERAIKGLARPGAISTTLPYAFPCRRPCNTPRRHCACLAKADLWMNSSPQ